MMWLTIRERSDSHADGISGIAASAWSSSRRNASAQAGASAGFPNCTAAEAVPSTSLFNGVGMPSKSVNKNQHFEADGGIVYRQACALGCEGIVSKRLGSPDRAGRTDHWIKIKNPAAPAVKREAEEERRK